MSSLPRSTPMMYAPASASNTRELSPLPRNIDNLFLVTSPSNRADLGTQLFRDRCHLVFPRCSSYHDLQPLPPRSVRILFVAAVGLVCFVFLIMRCMFYPESHVCICVYLYHASPHQNVPSNRIAPNTGLPNHGLSCAPPILTHPAYPSNLVRQ